MHKVARGRANSWVKMTHIMRGSDQGLRPRSGLRVGEMAPEFTLPDGATSAPVALAAVSGGRDTLLVFFREPGARSAANRCAC
jgi:hypothetical protein